MGLCRSSRLQGSVAVFIVVLVCAIFPEWVAAQDVVRIPMQIVPAEQSPSWAWSFPENPGKFSLPGGLVLESLAPASTGCHFRLPSGEEVGLATGGWRMVNIQRGSRLLPYVAICEEQVQTGKKVHALRWKPQYRAEGTLVVGDCSRMVAVFDLDGDGVFDRKDLTNGTALAIDVNNDGRFWGAGEWFKEGDIFQVCGKRWEIASLSPTGDWIEFRESRLAQVHVGQPPPPSLKLQTDDGKTVDIGELRGRWYAIDFWASWCVPCLQKFPELRQLSTEMGDRLGIYLVNVDDADRLDLAKEAIAKFDLPYPKSWSGKGQDDVLWRTFGTVLEDHLSIPLYVLVDPDNRLSVITHDVKDLRAAILKQP